MSRIEQALEKANKIRHSIKQNISEETNNSEILVFPAKKMNIMSSKSVLIGLILSVIVASLLLFSIVNYFVLKTLTKSPHMKPSTPIQREELSQQIQPQDHGLPKETVSFNRMENTRKEIKEESSKLQKPSKAIFTIQAGAFRNAVYAKALATGLEEKGYKVYITPLEEKDGKIFKVCIGNFSNRQEAENLSKKIKKTGDLQTFITLY